MLAFAFAPLLAVTLAAADGAAGAGASDAGATVVRQDDKAIAKRALEALGALEEGRLDRALLTPAFRADFSDAVETTDAALLRGRGAPKRFVLLRKTDLGDRVTYVYVASWEGGSLSYTFGLERASDLIDALYFRPAGGASP